MDASAISFPVLFEGLPQDHQSFNAGFSLDNFNDTLYIYGGYSLGQQLFVLKSSHTISQDSGRSWEHVSLSKCLARAAHTTFNFGNKMYVHGGYGAHKGAAEHSALSSCEEIDLDSFETKQLQYSAVVANVERRWHSSFTLGNKAFLHGGWNNGGPLGDLVCLNMEDMKWETLNPENPPSARRWHTVTPMQDNKFVLFGGYDGNHSKLFSDTHVLDMNKLTWTISTCKGEKPCARRSHTMTHLSSKTLFLLAGHSESHGTSHDAFMLHTDDMSWQKVKNLGDLFYITRSAHKSVKVGEHGLVVVGGYRASYIDPVYYLDTRMLQF